MHGIERRVLKHPSGRKITYETLGERTGTPVLYFHGWGSIASSIFCDEKFLQQNRLYILMVNRPGYGGSDLIKDYSMEDHADDVKAVMDHLDIDQAHGIAWSNGGLFSQVFAYRYPQSLSSLSLAASAVPLQNKVSSKVLPFRWKLISKLYKMGPFFLRGLLKHINRRWTGSIGRKLSELHDKERHSGNQNDLKEQLKKQTSEGLLEAYRTKGWVHFAELQAMMNPFRLPEWKSPFPVYLWYASKDHLWPEKTTLYLQRKYHDSRVLEVKGEGHFFFLISWKQILVEALSLE
ncbi:alpha/beta hydrolase [Bacillus sp. SG-1]|uniref:alpha/beta hydrolase n=1 Tax=Bacillus sp. SG-1 TaxID=161544 RepID=UPI000154452E|nr:alpha/beta hydrolase [Bacillus sp. SG-1]EDL64493.1 predicted Hydrolase or acyltransferase (alpha/beta hydrolase superfamily) protein [Bacillus sp. SG-1]